MIAIDQDLLLLLISVPALVCFGMGVALGLSLRRRIKCDWTALPEDRVSINTGYKGVKRDGGYDVFEANGYTD